MTARAEIIEAMREAIRLAIWGGEADVKPFASTIDRAAQDALVAAEKLGVKVPGKG